MTIDDKLNLIALLEAVRPYIDITISNAEEVIRRDDDEIDPFYHVSVINEANRILDRIDKSITVLMEN